eukprot:1852773-Prymnesium_polylepis.1
MRYQNKRISQLERQLKESDVKRIELKAQLLRTNAQLEEALDTLQKTTRALRAVGEIYPQGQPAIAAATATAGVGRGSSS